ncbi:MAG: enoyl-CoA hydratase/isomerase family protein [Pseudomonadota bacterium]
MSEQTLASDAPSQSAPAIVIAAKNRAAAVVTLNRPKALNALNADMRLAVSNALRPLARDPEIYALILRSNSEKAFCAGGDVRELVAWAENDPQKAKDAFAAEYLLDWALECFTKPTVSLANGFVMGSGAGLTAYNTHRVGGERYAFAMPETAIGFFPDVGMAHVLSRLPDHIGVYLGLTGARIGRDDAFHLGLLTHLIDAEHFDHIEDRLADAWPIDEVLDTLNEAPGEGELAGLRATINHCFSAVGIEEIVARLDQVNGDDREWAKKTADDLRQRSPLALKVTLQHIRQAARLELRETLQSDHRLALRFLSEPDFAEGVRAALIDKDGQPQWQPANLSEITQERVDAMFTDLGADELDLPTRENMQDLRKS